MPVVVVMAVVMAERNCNSTNSHPHIGRENSKMLSSD